MKRFIQSILFFFLPIVLIGSTLELFLKRIPNEYKYKRDYLNENSNNLEVLVLGSSHAYYGINPVFIKEKSFNAAYISQSLDLDLELLRKYKNELKELKFLVLPISFFSLNTQLKSGVEAWRVENYRLYYNINKRNNIFASSELLNLKFKNNMLRFFAYYVKGDMITCNKLGWGTNFHSTIKKDLEKTGINSAIRHTSNAPKVFLDNLNVLKNLINFANQKKIEVILITPPAYKTYVAHLEIRQLSQIINISTSLQKNNSNVKYLNLLNNQDFVKEDFFDADHLNEIGAKKLTMKIDSLISKIKSSKK